MIILRGDLFLFAFILIIMYYCYYTWVSVQVATQGYV
jgi:hypothetical protein